MGRPGGQKSLLNQLGNLSTEIPGTDRNSPIFGGYNAEILGRSGPVSMPDFSDVGTDAAMDALFLEQPDDLGESCVNVPNVGTLEPNVGICTDDFIGLLCCLMNDKGPEMALLTRHAGQDTVAYDGIDFKWGHGAPDSVSIFGLSHRLLAFLRIKWMGECITPSQGLYEDVYLFGNLYSAYAKEFYPKIGKRFRTGISLRP